MDKYQKRIQAGL